MKTPIEPTLAQLSVKFQQAMALHRSGHLPQAQAIYDEILRVKPRHFDALHLSGVIAAQTSDPQKAAALIGKALQIDPNNGAAYAAYRNLGSALSGLKQWDAALAAFNHAIAIKADFAEAHFGRGLVLHELKRWEAALASYTQAIAAKADFAAAHANRGTVLHALGRLEAALAGCERAIAIDARLAEAYFNRGNILKDLRQWDRALDSYNQGIAIKGDSAEAHSNRGAVLNELGQWEAALASCDRAIEIKPGYAEGHCNRALVLKELGQWDAALAGFDKAIAIKPDYAECHSNRGILLHELRQLDQALASYDRAIAIRPDYARARFNRSCALLLQGNYELGWSEFEWRWKSTHGSDAETLRNLPQPRWRGEESLAGKTILIYVEQGLGDTIQFCRYVERVADLGARVILEVQEPLKALLADLEGVAQLLVPGDALPAFDYSCPLMSLPWALKTTLSTVPARVPYLKADADKVLYWKEKLGDPRSPRVGLVWSGGFRSDQPQLWSVNSRRNIPLAKLALLKHPTVEFYSLQKGQPAESELAALTSKPWDDPPVTDFTRLLSDFSDTAALIENLDLIISVDTSTAHLAGALGKPVWILNRFDGCWRWLLNGTDTPWYPTAKLYRQGNPGDWDGVLQRVRADLIQAFASG